MHVQLCGCVVGRDVVKNIAPAFNTFHQSVTPIGRLKGFVNQGHHQLIQSLGDLSVQGFHVLKVAKNSAQANLRLRCDLFCRRGGVALANEMDESGNNFFPRFDTAAKTAICGRSRRNCVSFFSENVQICGVHGQKIFAGLNSVTVCGVVPRVWLVFLPSVI